MAKYVWYANTEPTWAFRHEHPAGHPDAGAAIDYTTASAWSLKLVAAPSRGTTALEKTSGITGYSDTSPPPGYTAADKPPNVIAVFTSGELASVTPGTYFIECVPTVSGAQPTLLGWPNPDEVEIRAAAPAAP